MGGSVAVLHVDDDPSFGELTKTFLEREHDQFTVETVTSANEGLERIADGSPDCVVSDYNMPGTDGLEFLGAVREEYPDLPFILFTGKGSEEVASDAIAAGVTDYIQKGSGSGRYDLLANRIQNAVAARRDATQATRQRDLMKRAEVLGSTGGWELRVESEDLRLTDGIKRLYGIDPDRDPSLDEVIGLYEPESQDRIRATIDAAIEDGYATADELHLRTTNGNQRVVEGNAELVETDGDSTLLRGVIRDITDRQERQEELEEYGTIVEALADPVYVIDENGRFSHVNDEFVELVGYDKETILGSTPSLVKDADSVEQAEHQLGRLLSSDGPETVTFEVRIQPRTGDPIVCEDHMGVLPYDGEEFEGSVGVLRDITDRIEREEQLQQRDEELSRLHDATRDLLDASSVEGAATIASDAADDILDLTLNGIHLYDGDENRLTPTAVSDGTYEILDDVPAIDDGIAWDAFQEGEPLVYGDVRETENVLNTETPMRSEMYLPLGEYGIFIVSSTDVDAFDESDIDLAQTLAANTEAAFERLSREQELHTREGEFKQKNERLEEFASIVSHDLRSPLGVAKGHLELAEGTSQSDRLEKARDAIERSQALIEDLLTLAREGDRVDETEPVRLAKMAKNSWETVKTGHATVEAGGPCVIEADRSRLKQLFENLYRNAVEHGGDDVTVSVGGMSGGFYVADTGPGIPEDEREAVFEAGYSTSEDGTGFGLRIVEQIAEAHGWELAVTEGERGGARFEFTGVERVDCTGRQKP
jgi:PAS domain S-box-containing protein